MNVGIIALQQNNIEFEKAFSIEEHYQIIKFILNWRKSELNLFFDIYDKDNYLIQFANYVMNWILATFRKITSYL